MIRDADVADVPALRDIETAAGEQFRPLGMDVVADDAPPSSELLVASIRARRAWVVEDDRAVAGYLLADVVDRCAHVEQVTVHPRHARRRLGAALLDHLADRARTCGLRAVTLTTYRDVPWNGPYDESVGFRWLADHEITPGLAALRAREVARGLDRWPRGGMRRDLPAG